MTTTKKETFGKLIFHNYLPVIDKSKYWQRVSLLLVWRGDNSEAWASKCAQIGNVDEKLLFCVRDEGNKRKSYLKRSLHDPNNKRSTPFEWKEINFSFFFLLSSRAFRYCFFSGFWQTNMMFLQESFIFPTVFDQTINYKAKYHVKTLDVHL